jgi:hypothetical protein
MIGLILQITQETTGPDRKGIKTVVKNIGPKGIEPTLVQNGESPRSESKGKFSSRGSSTSKRNEAWCLAQGAS